MSPLYACSFIKFSKMSSKVAGIIQGVQATLLELKAFLVITFHKISQDLGHCSDFYSRILLCAPQVRHLSSWGTRYYFRYLSRKTRKRYRSTRDFTCTFYFFSMTTAFFRIYESRLSSQFVRITLLLSFTSKTCTRILLPAVHQSVGVGFDREGLTSSCAKISRFYL